MDPMRTPCALHKPRAASFGIRSVAVHPLLSALLRAKDVTSQQVIFGTWFAGTKWYIYMWLQLYRARILINGLQPC